MKRAAACFRHGGPRKRRRLHWLASRSPPPPPLLRLGSSEVGEERGDGEDKGAGFCIRDGDGPHTESTVVFL